MYQRNGYYIWWNSLQNRWMVQDGSRIVKRLVYRGAAERYADEH